MTPDQKFARWIKISSAIFVVIFAYFLIADFTIPLTPQSMVTRVVTKVSTQVNGQITSINVHNNQVVQKGDVLFEVDPQPYELAVEKAKINLDLVKQKNAQLDSSIMASKATVKAQRVVMEQKQREADRLSRLFKRSGTSRQQFDDANSVAIAAQANLQVAQSNLKELQVSRGALDDDKNVSILAARNQLEQAQLNLKYTTVVADHDGVVTNLQLEPGTYATVGTPLIALVADKMDIIADFREKSLRHYAVGDKAEVSFDSKPGQIFKARIVSIDAGVSAGQFDANGRLATPSSSNRWVRDAQRMRIHLALVDNNNMHFNTGAKATVQLVPDNSLVALLARAQIRFISVLHYIY
ncbi:HlyD family secretion protein [Vibrio palustris]|uniref:Inner membrane protein YibH n=1 Tax=Vibrio palustris TaxID=1918946 RepID=A0A1R4B5Y1_9VIBR|nr:HlyD family secretion protein [Vibrio palustris]SJL84330.1 Inner membrane protein YibH [Vibrio palustris]